MTPLRYLLRQVKIAMKPGPLSHTVTSRSRRRLTWSAALAVLLSALAMASWPWTETRVGAQSRPVCSGEGCLWNHRTSRCDCRPSRPAPTSVESNTDQRTGVTWVRIPGGAFDMGSPRYDKGRQPPRRRPGTFMAFDAYANSTSDSERPVHRVRVPTFWIARSEVTVEQYRRCVHAGRCRAPDTGTNCNWGKPGRNDHPVNCVDWNQARGFAAWAGGRLPSEAEWEYAARGGGGDSKFPWGDDAATCRRAVLDDGGQGCGRKSTWPVCSKSLGNTRQGLCDMTGNVFEWVQDFYHYSYSGAPVDGSAWERPSGDARVCRGGAWSRGAFPATVSYRDRHQPDYRHDAVGFRIARSHP